MIETLEDKFFHHCQNKTDQVNQLISDLENILDNTYLRTHFELTLYVEKLKGQSNEGKKYN